MKMANMDHVFDYMFTNPKDSQGVRPLLRLYHQTAKCAVITFLKWLSVFVCVYACRSPRHEIRKENCCILETCARVQVDSQSTCCGGDAGTPKVLG